MLLYILMVSFVVFSNSQLSPLKILGLYLYTLIIGQKYCNMLLSRLNKLTLQKKLQNFVTNNEFFYNK